MTTTTVDRRALMVTPLVTLLDGPVRDLEASCKLTPADTWAQGFGMLLDRISKTIGAEAVVLLDTAAAHALKIPAGPGETATVGLDDARAAGWLHGRVGPWTTFYGAGRPSIVVGLPEWPDFDRCPLHDAGWYQNTIFRLSLWQRLTGHAWRGTPGVAAMTILRGTAPEYPVRGRKLQPSFTLNDENMPADAYELDYEPENWSRPQTTRYAHGYDVTRMYLAAAQSCEKLAPWQLRHSGRIDFTPTLAGWWRVKLGPWQDDRIPAPAGTGYGDEPERWVTTPTMVLLTELADDGGPFQPFEVVDSWTGSAKRILRSWAETLEGAYQEARVLSEVTDDAYGLADDGQAVMGAVKSTYKEGWGLLNYRHPETGKPNAVYRPDWHYAILAQARANLWRRMWSIGQTEDRWPLEVKVDHVWYGATDADPVAAKPAGIPLVRSVKGTPMTDVLGTFKPKGTREMQTR